MTLDEREKVLHYTMERGGATLKCRLHIFTDNSAHIEGDDIEAVFEENSLSDAMAYLDRIGYRLITPVG